MLEARESFKKRFLFTHSLKVSRIIAANSNSSLSNTLYHSINTSYPSIYNVQTISHHKKSKFWSGPETLRIQQHSIIGLYLNGYSTLWICDHAAPSITIQSQEISFIECRDIGYDDSMNVLRSSQSNIIKSGITEIGYHGYWWHVVIQWTYRCVSISKVCS